MLEQDGPRSGSVDTCCVKVLDSGVDIRGTHTHKVYCPTRFANKPSETAQNSTFPQRLLITCTAPGFCKSSLQVPSDSWSRKFLSSCHGPVFAWSQNGALNNLVKIKSSMLCMLCKSWLGRLGSDSREQCLLSSQDLRVRRTIFPQYCEQRVSCYC